MANTKKKKKSLLRHPLFVALIVPVLAWISDKLDFTTIYPSILDWIVKAGLWSWSIITYPVTLSAFWLLVIFISPVILIWAIAIYQSNVESKRLKNVLETPTKSKEPYLDYKKETFDSLVYRWDYLEYGNKIQIHNIVKYCPKDDCQLVDQGTYIGYYCPICRQYYRTGLSEEVAQIRIHHAIRKKFNLDQ